MITDFLYQLSSLSFRLCHCVVIADLTTVFLWFILLFSVAAILVAQQT